MFPTGVNAGTSGTGCFLWEQAQVCFDSAVSLLHSTELGTKGDHRNTDGMREMEELTFTKECLLCKGTEKSMETVKIMILWEAGSTVSLQEKNKSF